MTIIIDGDKGIINATWTTGNRPASPAAGQRGYNSTLNQMEVYIGTGWVAMGERFSGKGGTITTSGGYTIHTFTSSGIFIPNQLGSVEYSSSWLVVVQVVVVSWWWSVQVDLEPLLGLM